MPFVRALRRKNPNNSIFKIVWYEFIRITTWLVGYTLYRHRWWYGHRIPSKGPVLLVSNHQSFYDPPFIGVGIMNRHIHWLARSGLFKSGIAAGLLRSLNAFEIEQGKGDVKAIKQSIRVLGDDHLMCVFPEGTRTENGALHEFQKGVLILIRKAKPAIVPMAIEGLHDIWPLTKKVPGLRGRSGVMYGEPIDPEMIIQMPPDEALEFLTRQVETLRLDLRNRLRTASDARYPKPGPGDYSSVPLD